MIFQRIESAHWGGLLHGLVTEHESETGSRHARRLLDNWDVEQGRFWQICPKEMLEHLEQPLSDIPLAAAGE